MTSVLLLTRDPALVADLRRVVLAAGAEPVDAGSVARARPSWRSRPAGLRSRSRSGRSPSFISQGLMEW